MAGMRSEPGADLLVLHPGRVGVSDGLCVAMATGEGMVSPKAVQLLQKNAIRKKEDTETTDDKGDPHKISGKTLSKFVTDNWNDQVELYGSDVTVDEYLMASIRDSLRYIASSKVPELFKNWKVSMMFDRSVNVNEGGDSAGAAFAMATLSAVKRVQPEPNTCMTGAIRPYGDISAIGGVFAKATAAARERYKVMLAPSQNISELKVLDFDSLGAMQIIMGRRFDDYLAFCMPALSDDSSQGATVKGLYAPAYILYKLGYYGESRALVERLLAKFPWHFSALMLLERYDLAGIQSAPLPDALEKAVRAVEGGGGRR
jgi:hypothetical protein